MEDIDIRTDSAIYTSPPPSASQLTVALVGTGLHTEAAQPNASVNMHMHRTKKPRRRTVPGKDQNIEPSVVNKINKKPLTGRKTYDEVQT
jgi:hypothetical protein